MCKCELHHVKENALCHPNFRFPHKEVTMNIETRVLESEATICYRTMAYIINKNELPLYNLPLVFTNTKGCRRQGRTGQNTVQYCNST
jgi:hypothetical protein